MIRFMGEMNTDLTEFEYSVIKFILERDAPDLLSHLKNLHVDKRESTSVGSYVYLNDKSEINTPDQKRPTLGRGVNALFKISEKVVGVILYVENERIDLLEIFLQGDEGMPDLSMENTIISMI